MKRLENSRLSLRFLNARDRREWNDPTNVPNCYLRGTVVRSVVSPLDKHPTPVCVCVCVCVCHPRVAVRANRGIGDKTFLTPPSRPRVVCPPPLSPVCHAGSMSIHS